MHLRNVSNAASARSVTLVKTLANPSRWNVSRSGPSYGTGCQLRLGLRSFAKISSDWGINQSKERSHDERRANLMVREPIKWFRRGRHEFCVADLWISGGSLLTQMDVTQVTASYCGSVHNSP
jgi:hypothetical protein